MLQLVYSIHPEISLLIYERTNKESDLTVLT